jgi:hypothetical protein
MSYRVVLHRKALNEATGVQFIDNFTELAKRCFFLIRKHLTTLYDRGPLKSVPI